VSRIDTRFAALKAEGRKALVPFITAGDPSLAATVPVMHALVRGGADVIELGVPFSDPMADGPVIQLASERALQRRVGLRQVLDYVREFRRDDAHTPIVLMGYLNPVEIYGVERFAQAAKEADVDAVLLVDCPPEEAAPVRTALEARGLQQILLAAPTSNDERVTRLLRETRGYLYYVSFAGVTGASGLDIASVGRRLAAVRQGSAMPVAVGFGVRDAESACGVAAFADAVVIGSALVQVLSDAADPGEAADRAAAFLRPIRAALDASR
jgi:tryptophan synthase alpha chain